MNTECDVLLINPPHHKRHGSGVIFPLGLGYLKSTLEINGYNTTILDCSTIINSLDQASLEYLHDYLINNAFRTINPHLAIGIGPCTTSSIRSIQLISDLCLIHFPKLPIIFGGPLASIKNQDWLFFEKFHAKYVIPGDGEYVFSDLIYAISTGKPVNNVKGVICREGQDVPINIISNLDELPFPWRPHEEHSFKYKASIRRDLLEYPVSHIVTSRGCPFGCNFCLSGSLRKGNYTRRTWKSIGDEIDSIIKTHKIRSLIFYDDSLFPSPPNLSRDIYEMTLAIAENKGKFVWQCEMHPRVFQSLNTDLAARLYDYGCRQINIGIEATNSEVGEKFGKIIDSKNVKEKCETLLEKVPKLRLAATFILGGPQESIQSAEETVRFAASLPILFAHFYPLKIYPGTTLYNNIYGDLSPRNWYEQIMQDDLPWGEVLYCETNRRDEIFKLISWAYSYFYNRPEWIARAQKSLGEDNCEEILKQISVWTKDRFALAGS